MLKQNVKAEEPSSRATVYTSVQARNKSMGSPTRKAGSDAASIGGSSLNTSMGRTSSIGGTSFTSRTSGAVAARRAARESRDSWMRAPGSTSEPEEKVRFWI
jgi:hypothetical protein